MTLTAKYTSGRLAFLARDVAREEAESVVLAFYLALSLIFFSISLFPTYVAIAFGEMFCNF